MEKLPREKQETLERGLSGIPRLFRNRSASCAAGGKADLVLLDRICEDTPDCMENSLKVHVSSLRRKMKEDTGKNYMEDASLFLYIDSFIKICRCERRDF